MAGYLRSNKLTNVKGRIKYITNEKKQENIVDYFNTTDTEFWKMLSAESQKRHKEVSPGGKCCEARELIIGIPKDSNITAKQLCDTFKNKYDVECTCAIHQNNKNDVVNRHCHLIFSERIKLEQPKIVEEKRATRTYYYDSKGKKCKKAEAVKIVEKGTLLQKGNIRYFSDKNEIFKSQKFVNECKELFLKNLLQIDWSYETEKQNKGLSEKHIGKNNPKAEYIKDNNHLKALLKKVCKASDFIFEQENGTTLENFKKDYKITNFATKNYEENGNKAYSFVKEIQSIYKERVRNEVNEHNMINQDINFLQQDNYILKHTQERIVNAYEPQLKTRNKPKIIEFLQNKLSNMLNRIKILVSLQGDICIESKNSIEVYQDKRNNNLRIEDQSYIREQKQNENELDYEP